MLYLQVMRRELQSREDDLVKKESAINVLQHDKQSTMSRLELVEGKKKNCIPFDCIEINISCLNIFDKSRRLRLPFQF